MKYDDIDYVALRRRVDEGLKRDKRTMRLVMFAVNLFLYVLFMIIAWAIVSSSFYSNASLGALIMLSVGWGINLFMQGMTFIADTAAGERQMRQQVMTREIQRLFDERAQAEMEAAAYLQEKAKRGGRLEVAEDGELIEIVDDDSDALLRNAVAHEQLKRSI